MTPKQQRIAIAEACGWHHTHITGNCPCGIHPKLKSDSDDYQQQVPDYPNDLNAMHEAEKTLSQYNRDTYGRKLACLKSSEGFDDTSHFTSCHATASQRAEAFLRTIGRWIE